MKRKKDNHDKISYLPDDIQNQIVSYLPTVDAYKTSLLSTRWRKVCSSLSNFDFHLHNFSYHVNNPRVDISKAFTNFIHQTLLLHDESDINSFSLEFGCAFSVPSLSAHVYEWLSFATSHNVKQLQFLPHGKSLGDEIFLPPSLFTCSSLTEILLADVNLIFPKHITFPKLKSLTLRWVTLVDTNDVKRLCLSSPLLEFLSLVGCSWQYLSDTLVLPSPNLKVLILSDEFEEIELSATNLIEFWYEGIPVNFSTNIITSSLVEAHFDISIPSWQSIELSDNWAGKILERLSNVNKLGLHGDYIQYLASYPDLITPLPTLSRTLKDLSLTLTATVDELKIIILLLRSYPCLQTLTICFEPCISAGDFEQYEETGGSGTQAMLNQLTCVEIYCFNGCKIELGLIRYLLGNASALEKMEITFARQSYAEYQGSTIMKEKIQMLTRVSPNVVISISS